MIDSNKFVLLLFVCWLIITSATEHLPSPWARIGFHFESAAAMQAISGFVLFPILRNTSPSVWKKIKEHERH
jgi:hypothetical protein